MESAALLTREKPVQANVPPCQALVPSGVVHGWWPVVKMSDGTLRKGPFAEIVGRWSNDG